MKHTVLCAILAAAAAVSSEMPALPLAAKQQSVIAARLHPAANLEEPAEQNADSAGAVLDLLKNSAPSISEDGTSIVLPQSPNDAYEVILYGSSNEAVISMDGKIHAPLEDMEVSVMYKVVNKDDAEDFALDQKAEASIVIPGRFTREESDNPRPDVLPGIQEWKGGQGSVVIDEQSRLIVQDEALTETAQIVAEYYESMLGRTIEISQDVPAAGDIVLSLSDALSVLGKEGYEMNTADVVSIAASEAKGVLYGGTTLIQILMQTGNTVSKGMIRDYPAYEVRSCMQDVARFYMPLDYLEEVTKYMAFFKLNEFHVHINDNGGEQSHAMRVESKKYPLLNSGLKPEEVYSQEDYRDYQKRCAKYGIEVVTEIDTPAHSGFIADYDSSLMLDGYHINLANENVLPFIKSLLDEYLDGDDPVFQGTKFNIGTDEYNKDYSEDVRAYMNELIEYVSGKGREVRMWASLGTNGFNGTTPVSRKAVGHYWSASWASYDEMLNMGYPCINNNDGNLYSVPGAGYYHDYIDFKNLYNNWEANYLVPSYHIAKSNPLMLGSEAACWYDAKTGMSEFDIFDRTRQQIALMAEKNWSGARREGQSAEEFAARVEKLGKTAPGVNPARYIPSESQTVLSYDFEEMDGNTVLDGSENGYDGTILNTTVEADPLRADNQVLQLNGAGSLSMPFDSMGFPYSISFDLFLDGAQPENAILFSGKDGVMYANYEGSGKIAYQRKGYTYLFDVKVPENVWITLLLTCDHSTERLYFNGMFAAQGHYYNVTGASKEASSTFVLPLEEVGSGIHGAIDNVTISNQPASYEEISGLNLLNYANRALNKPVAVSGLEVYDGRFTAEMANDGDAGTRVSLERKDDAWWQVDLEDIYKIDKVVINWNEKPNSYQIQVSEDGENWTTVYEDRKCTERASGVETISFNRKVSARYVRYQQLKQFLYGNNNSYYSGNFREFEVWTFGSQDNPVLARASQLLQETEQTPDNAAVLEKLALALQLYDWAMENGTTEEMALVVVRIQDICDALEAGSIWPKADCSALLEQIHNKKDLTSYTDTSAATYQIYYRIGLGSLLEGTLPQASIDAISAMLAQSEADLEIRDFISVSASRAIYQTNSPDHLIDGNDGTYFWQNTEQKIGDSITMRFRNPQKLHKITVSSKGCGGDTLSAAVVKLSMDGISWKTVGTLDSSEVQSVEFEEQSALYAVIELTAAKSNWWKLNEVTFNDGLLCDRWDLEQEINAPVNMEGCTTSSIARYQEALEQAKTVLASQTVTQKDVNAALQALKDAKAALEVIGDLTVVEQAIAACEGIGPDGYTAYSYAALQDALQEARALVEDLSDAGARTIERVAGQIHTAYEQLKTINGADSSVLDAKLDHLIENGTAYSLYSWQAYLNTAAQARAYSAGEMGPLSQEGIEEYCSALDRIAGSLKIKEQSNIALHKPVTCSGLEVDRENARADKVTDGDLTTRIALHQKDDAWITIDLEEARTIDRVIFRWKERPRQYKVQVSMDGETWQDVYLNTKCDGGTAGDDIIDFVPVQARYVKYQQIQMQVIGYSGTCWEFEVYNSDMSLYQDELNWQIAQASALDAQTLNEGQKTALAAAIAGGREALNGQEQQPIENAVTALRGIRLAILSQGNPQMLAAAIEQAEALHEEDYTPASWSPFAAALAQAKERLANGGTQAQIDQALAALIEAQAALAAKADKTLLVMAAAYADKAEKEGALNGVNVLAVQEFQQALAQAKALCQDDNASQRDVNEAWLRLSKAIHMLSFKTDKEELKALIDQASAIDLNAYADGEAKDAFIQALEKAREVLEDPAALSEVSIAKAVEALQNAIADLEIRVDTSLLAWLVAQTEPTDLSLYVSTEAFEQALAHAKDVLAAPQSQQQVEEAVNTLHEAWLNLRRRPDESALQALKDLLGQLKALPQVKDEKEEQKIERMILRIEQALDDPNLSAEQTNALLEEGKAILSISKPSSSNQSTASSVKTAAGWMQEIWTQAGLMALAACALLSGKRKKR